MSSIHHELILKDECYKIIGACMAVHRELGCGFLEPVYQEALAIEFQLQDIPFRKEVDLNITYKKHILSKCYSRHYLL